MQANRQTMITTTRRTAAVLLLSGLLQSPAASAPPSPEGASPCAPGPAVDCRVALHCAIASLTPPREQLGAPFRSVYFALGPQIDPPLGSLCSVEAQQQGSRRPPLVDTIQLAKAASARDEPDLVALGYVTEALAFISCAEWGNDDSFCRSHPKDAVSQAAQTIGRWLDRPLDHLASRYSPTLFFLAAQLADRQVVSPIVNRDLSTRKKSEDRATAFIELFRLDSRVFAAHLIRARARALMGRYDDALDDLRQIQTFSRDADELAASRQLASLIWLHRRGLEGGTFQRKTQAQPTSAGPILDLALAPSGALVVSGENGVVVATSASDATSRVPPLRIEAVPRDVDCTSVRVSYSGRLYAYCDRDLWVGGARQVPYAGGDDDAQRAKAEPWLSDLRNASLVGVDGEGNCAFMTSSDCLLLSGCRCMDPDPPNLLRETNIGRLAGCSLVDSAAFHAKVARRSEKDAIVAAVLPPATVGQERQDQPINRIRPPSRVEEVLDVESDGLGWLYFLHEDRDGFGLTVWDPKTPKIFSYTPLEKNLKKAVRPSCIMPDGAAGVFIGYENGEIRRWKWSQLP